MTDLVAARLEAAELAGDAPPEVGWCRWVEQRLIEAGELAHSPWWWRTLEQFWRSDRTAFACTAAFRSGKSTAIISMAAVPAALFRERMTFAGAELVLPVMSSDVTEANGRLRTVAACLRAVGLNEIKKKTKDEALRMNAGEFFLREGGLGRGGCEFLDVSGNRAEIRTQPANLSGASGYTGIDVMADEVDLWEGPAPSILEALMARLKGQRGTRGYATSKSFNGPLTRMVKRGSNEGTYVATIGEEGARDDETGRLTLRDYLRARGVQGDRDAARYATDSRLTELSDPASPFVPAWVALPVGAPGEYGAGAAALECWRLASTGWGLEEGEELLDGFFRAYGGRPYGGEGHQVIDGKLLLETRDVNRLRTLQ